MAARSRRKLQRYAGESELHAAERYLEYLEDLPQGEYSPEELQAMRKSVEAISRGDMTLAEFETRHEIAANE